MMMQDWYYQDFIDLHTCRIGMARMDTVDLSSGSEVYTPDVEEVSLIVLSHLLRYKINLGRFDL